MTYQPLPPLVHISDRKEDEPVQGELSQPPEAPASEGTRLHQAGTEDPRSAPQEGDVTRTWASKWLHFCRSYGIDPAWDVSDVVARFDHTGEERERIARGIKG